MCYIPTTTLPYTRIPRQSGVKTCPHCNQDFILCPCCGEPVSTPHNHRAKPWTRPYQPPITPYNPPYIPPFPEPVDWSWNGEDMQVGTPYNPNSPFTPRA